MSGVRDEKSAVTVLRVLHGDAENRLVRSFRPRRRKLGPELTRVYDRLRSTWSVAEHGSVLDLSAVFANDNPVCLEIGCGRGDLAIAFAPSHPDVNLIAIDIHTRGIANILQAIENFALVNTRVVEGDVLVLLQRIAVASLDEVWIFFPDPWPKQREQSRRLLRPEVVAQIAEVLKPGGCIRLATDIEDYWRKSSDIIASSGFFAAPTVGRPEWRIETVFEKRGNAAGLPAVDMSFERL